MKVLMIFCLYSLSFCANTETRKFPDDFLIGVATSAYQIEGAWNEEGKGENIWDRMVHTQPEKILDKSTGDVACDSYHKVKEDVALVKSLGMQHYRISISWSRILPGGFSNKINQVGVKYYNELIDALLAEGIIPMVTIYHWDLPQILQDLGGWINPDIKFWFEDYARVLYQNFGDRVKTWVTINEPKSICEAGYGRGQFAPGYNYSGIADYLCARNVLLAHAQAYHLYNREFKNHQKGRVGIVIECSWAEPGTNSVEDHDAARRNMEFEFGIYANPIFNKGGDFPDVVKEFVDRRSLAEGFTNSRLPKLSSEMIEFLKETSDFYGLNHYTTSLIKAKEAAPIGDPSRSKDKQLEEFADSSWIVGPIPYFKLVPWGFRKILNYVKENYGNPEIIVTENGFPDHGELDDQIRIKYHKEYLGAMLDAMYLDGVNVKGYTAWSIMDNFEWAVGYMGRFGLHYVNFTDPDRKRTPKSSSIFFKNLASSRTLTEDDNE